MTAVWSNYSAMPQCHGARARGLAHTSRVKGHGMNWDLIRGNWMQFKAGVQGNWVKLTDEDLTRIGGRRDELVKRLQARYGFSKNEAQREIEAWVKTQRYAA